MSSGRKSALGGEESSSSASREKTSSIRECLYAILGIQNDADEAEIKKAYRKLALRWHPDKNPEKKERAERMFKRIAAAYEVLSDGKRRAEYDRYGFRGETQQAAAHQRRTTPAEFAYPPGGFPHGFRSPFDIFREFFGDPFVDFCGPHAPFFNFGRETCSSRHRRRHTTNLFAGHPFVDKDENNCEFSTVIRFSSSTKEPGKKLKKTITQTRNVDGKRIVTKRIEDDGEEVVEVLENGVVLKSRLINGYPVEIKA